VVRWRVEVGIRRQMLKSLAETVGSQEEFFRLETESEKNLKIKWSGRNLTEESESKGLKQS
jgi:hypothetical protein